MSDTLNIWTITDNPSDFPGKFVARRHVVGGASAHPTDQHFVADTLAEIRAALPSGLICIARGPEDDPVIVESWI